MLASDDADDGPAGSTTHQPSASTSDGPSTTSEETSRSDLPGVCENPRFQCSEPVDCSLVRCGELDSTFDEQGCLRLSCRSNASDCPEGQQCFTPMDWSSCTSSNISCREREDGPCVCAVTDDCGGAYCVPADQAPPLDGCDASSPDACIASGCRAPVGRRVLTAGAGCACDLETPYCVWWPTTALVEPDKTAYLQWEDDEVVVFPWLVDPPPLGWTACDALPFAHPGCVCAENLPCAMD